MEAHTLLQQMVAQYRQINQLNLEIERAVLKNSLEDIAGLYTLMHQAQDEATIGDTHLLALLRNQPKLKENPAVREWLSLMRMIHIRNQKLLPRINSILALQRSELQTLRKGASVLQGYRPTTIHTGRRLSSSG